MNAPTGPNEGDAVRFPWLPENRESQMCEAIGRGEERVSHAASIIESARAVVGAGSNHSRDDMTLQAAVVATGYVTSTGERPFGPIELRKIEGVAALNIISHGLDDLVDGAPAPERFAGIPIASTMGEGREQFAQVYGAFFKPPDLDTVRDSIEAVAVSENALDALNGFIRMACGAPLFHPGVSNGLRDELIARHAEGVLARCNMEPGRAEIEHAAWLARAHNLLAQVRSFEPPLGDQLLGLTTKTVFEIFAAVGNRIEFTLETIDSLVFAIPICRQDVDQEIKRGQSVRLSKLENSVPRLLPLLEESRKLVTEFPLESWPPGPRALRCQAMAVAFPEAIPAALSTLLG